MPPGLWVLPLSATVDTPPAPPPVAPEDPQQLLQVRQTSKRFKCCYVWFG
jgi:hypothetical protein